METEASTPTKKYLLIPSCFLLLLGSSTGPLITRLYFLHGGKRLWLSSCTQTLACPIILVPLSVTYLNRRKTQGSNAKILLMRPYLFISSLLVGLIIGTMDYLYAYASSKLPVSTSSIIVSSQLAFTAAFAYFLVKQKITHYSVNSVFLLTIGATILGLHAGSDRPEGESTRDYILGFVMMILAAIMYGFVMPLIEYFYSKANQEVSYTLAMEFNMFMCISATTFCTVGMLISKDFQAIAKEAREYDLGEVKYYGVLVCSAIIWQLFLVGVNGVVFLSSALLSGILGTVALPITEVLAVIFYGEKFQVEKGVSLALSLWGFASYFYGEIKLSRKMRKQLLEQEGSNEKSAITLQHESAEMELHQRL